MWRGAGRRFGRGLWADGLLTDWVTAEVKKEAETSIC